MQYGKTNANPFASKLWNIKSAQTLICTAYAAFRTCSTMHIKEHCSSRVQCLQNKAKNAKTISHSSSRMRTEQL
jgi:hypothetical protein